MSSKKVLLLNPPAEKLYQNDNYCSYSSKAGYYMPFIDLLVQSGILSSEFEVSVLDAVVMSLSKGSAAKIIEEISPDAIIFVTGTASWKQNFAFIESVKGSKPIRIVGSGGNLLFEAKSFLNKYSFLDAVLLDYTSDAVVRYLNDEEIPIPDLACKHDGSVVIGPRSGYRDPISYPPPRHDLFPLKRYRLPYAKTVPFTQMIASSGCPFRCSFCIAAQIPYRERRIENLVEELKVLKNEGIHQIFFSDPTFTVKKDRTIKICQAIIDVGTSFHWSCNTRADTLDAELLEMMKKAGCHIVHIGVESGDQFMLDKYSKGMKIDTLQRVFKMCKEAKIEVLGYFIIGLPGETRDTAMKTIRLARELDPDYVSFDIATPDYGTELMREAKEKGWIAGSLDSFDSTTYPVITIDTLTKEDVWKLRNIANITFYLRPGYIVRRLLKMRNLRELKTVISMGSNLILNMLRRD